jgi:trk system potassium uptake protein TrkA
LQILILGAGQVGATVAQDLSRENHDVVIVDRDADRLRELQARLDIGITVGHASYPEILREAGADHADMIIAVTDSDEVNMIACQVAYSLFNTPKKLARVRSPHYFIRKELFSKENLPVDVFISPEQLVMTYIKQLIDYPGALQVLSFAHNRLKLVDIKPFYGGPLVGRTLNEIGKRLQEKKVDARVAALFRGQRSVPLGGETVMEVGDEVFFVAASDHIPTIMKTLKRWDYPFKRVMIVGGGQIGSRLAQNLEHDYHVKLIENRPDACRPLAEQLHRTIVLSGDGTDAELLRSENIEQVDIFCSLTNDEEANIMSCMLAKRLGARQVMTLVNRPAYVDLIEGSEIDIAVSPQQITSGAIFKHIRRGDIINVHTLRRGAAEVIEAVAHGDSHTSYLVGRRYGELRLPKGTSLSALVRDNNVIIPKNDTKIASGDHMVLFVSDKRSIRDVERMFQVSIAF